MKMPATIRFHQIRENEDIKTIAAKYDLDPQQIQKENPQVKIQIGEILVLNTN